MVFRYDYSLTHGHEESERAGRPVLTVVKPTDRRKRSRVSQVWPRTLVDHAFFLGSLAVAACAVGMKTGLL